ncbi:MAG: M48 family metalloprotease [Planctomycetes bacterium]|nr:M48 family metalloprotease [Planctomycetota bacterium]
MALFAGEVMIGPGWSQLRHWMSRMGQMQSVALVTGMIFLMWAFMRVVSQQVVLKLEATELPHPKALRLPGRVDLLMRIIILCAFGLQLTAGGWANLVCLEWRLQRIVLLDEIILMLPFVVMILMNWYCFYPVNRFVREYVVTGQLADGLSARPVWRRSQYMSFNIRGSLLIVLVLLLLIYGWRDVVDIVMNRWFSETMKTTWWDEGIIFAGSATIFILAPLLLRFIWKTRTLPAGPLRERLEGFCRRIRLNYREILLWDTYSAVANAAVMGLIKPVRYVLLSDALIENMGDDQIEAVFGHEAGHVRHHHILFLLLYMGAGIAFMGLLIQLLFIGCVEVFGSEETWSWYYTWIIGGFSTVLFLAWILMFGWVSRRFERQADVHAAQTVGQGKDHNEDNNSRLSTSGAWIMETALIRIAQLNGMSIDARSWRHSSIASRAAFLRQLAEQDGALDRFMRLVQLIKVMIIVCGVIDVGGWIIIELMNNSG